VTVTDQWKGQREALGAFIRTQRKMANLSLRQLAELTSLSNPYLSQVERGLHQPSVRVLKALSDALNVSAETLLAASRRGPRKSSGQTSA
jgi:transcriptional regulator with XRE-family HTH domain